MEETNGTAPAETPQVAVIQTINQSLAEKVAKETCILEIHRHEPGFERKVSSELILNSSTRPEISGIDPKSLSVSKALIERKEIKTLQKHRSDFFQSLKDLSLPGGLLTLGNGQYLIPLNSVNEVKAKIDKYLSERSTLLDDFETRYPEIIETAKQRLGGLFDSQDYPPFYQIRNSYNTTYKFLSNSVPEEIERVSKEIYEQERARMISICEGATVLIQTTLRERFCDLIDHFKSRLGTDEKTGKPKRFHGSNIEHVKEFVAAFGNLNIMGDKELENLVKQSGDLLNGVDPDKVRTDDEFRAEIEKSFEDIKNAADNLVVDRKRKVILED